MFQGFGAGAARFFEELAANNDREWWKANRARYEADVRAPLEHLLADLAGEFGEAKVFRPNRDTRFSADKSPYKTQAGAVIGDGVSSLYVHVAADGLMVAGGSHMPARDQLARLREAVADDRAGGALEAVVAELRRAGARIDAHDRLKTAPRGYPVDHPRIELLRLKGLIGVFDHPPGDWLQKPAVLDTVADGWRTLRALNRWLADHVGPSQLPSDHRR